MAVNSMKVITVDKGNMPASVARAVQCLRDGGIVAYPTESSYALGAAYDNTAALGRLFELKGRPQGKAMPLIIGDEASLRLVAQVPGLKERTLMERFWPGPLTILFRAKAGLSEYITYAGTVAVRAPGHPVAHAITSALCAPLTATSANPSGAAPANSAQAVTDYFKDNIDLVLDSGPAGGATASTIVEVTEDGVRLIREGAVSIDEIMRSLKP